MDLGFGRGTMVLWRLDAHRTSGWNWRRVKRKPVTNKRVLFPSPNTETQALKQAFRSPCAQCAGALR
jgi:hypothetical protein